MITLTEVADVVYRSGRLDLEAGISRHAEALAGLIRSPVGFALDARAAGAGRDFHDLGHTGVEHQ